LAKKYRMQSELILVDNSPHTYVFNKSNGIPIIPFYDNYEDNEL
jgi:CTD small phosphatase-like protein 2